MPDVPGPSPLEPSAHHASTRDPLLESPLLASLDLVTFDCFGTLVDWQQALPALGIGLDRMDAFLEESERLQRPQRRDATFVDYRGLLAQVGSVLRPDLSADVVRKWARDFGLLPFFADTQASIALLGRVVDVGVISNCDAVHQLDVARRLRHPWDVCIVSEELGAYKPTDRAWDRAVAMVEHRGYDRARWLHVSAWDDYDLAPAGARGIRTAHVVRPGGRPPRHGSIDVSFRDLLHLARSIATTKHGPRIHELEARGAPEVIDRLVAFLLDEHLGEARACKGVRHAELLRMEAELVRCTYRFTSQSTLARYLDKDAPRLRARLHAVFPETEVTLTSATATLLHAL